MTREAVKEGFEGAAYYAALMTEALHWDMTAVGFANESGGFQYIDSAYMLRDDGTAPFQ